MPVPFHGLSCLFVLFLCLGCGMPAGQSSAADATTEAASSDDAESEMNRAVEVPPVLRPTRKFIENAHETAPRTLQETIVLMNTRMFSGKGVHPLLIERAKQMQKDRPKPDIRPGKTLFEMNSELNAMAMDHLWTSHQLRQQKSQENPFAQNKTSLDAAAQSFARNLELARKHWIGKSTKVTVRVAALDGENKQIRVGMPRSDEDLQGGLVDPVGDISKRMTFALIGRPRYQAFRESEVDHFSVGGFGWLHVPEDISQADSAKLKVGQNISLRCRILEICVMDRLPNYAFQIRPAHVRNYDGVRYFNPHALTQRLIDGEIDSVVNYYDTMLSMDRILIVAEWEQRPGINLQASVRPEAATAEISPAYVGRVREAASAVRKYFAAVGQRDVVPSTPEGDDDHRNEPRELLLKNLAAGDVTLLKTPWPVDGFGTGAVEGFHRWRLSQYAAVPKIDLLGKVYRISSRSRDLPPPPKTPLPDALLNAEWFKEEIHTGRLDPDVMRTYPYDQRGWNVLHYAIYNGHTDIVKELLLDPHRVDPYGRILHRNRWGTPTEKALLTKLGDPASKDDQTATLFRQVDMGLKDIVPESPYATPLHLAAIVDHVEAARVLIEEASHNRTAIRPLIAHAWLKQQHPFGPKYVDYSVLRTRQFNEVETVYQNDDHLVNRLLAFHHRRISTEKAFPKLYPDFPSAPRGPDHFAMCTWAFASQSSPLPSDIPDFSGGGHLHHVTINEPDAYGFTPLDYARLYGSKRVEQLLLQAKAVGNTSVDIMAQARE